MLLGVDVGGTFTDAVLVTGGRVVTAKAPTTPHDQSEGVLAAVGLVLERAGARAQDVTAFAHGTTVATNAVLEGCGARTVLIATAGFEDVVELGRQARADLYRLCARHPAPLAGPEARIGVRERMTPDGPLLALTAGEVARVVDALAALDPEAVAVCLLHAYRHPQHEQELGAAIAARLPGVHVSLSHEAVGTFREFERAATTELDAALSPLLSAYLGQLVERAAAAGLPEPSVMQSSGGLAPASEAGAHAAVALLSGPAGGAAGAAWVARAAGRNDAISFDMGGTSCDVCVISGGALREASGRRVGGRAVALPMLDLHTVGAGGGSIAWVDDGGALRVGPHSAGARPGPACYGHGGTEPTVTDANLVLGLLGTEPLPGAIVPDLAAARAAIGAVAEQAGLDLLACAQGIRDVANAEMARALRLMTVERGIDPRGIALIASGGAGGAHAVALADALDIGVVLCPRASGVLAALGLVVSERRRDVQRSVVLSGPALTRERLEHEIAALSERAGGCSRVVFDLRYRGQAFELAVESTPDPAALRVAFDAAHEAAYGYRDSAAELELVTLRVTASEDGPALAAAADPGAASERSTRRAWFEGTEVEATVIRGIPAAGERVQGPAIVELPEATLVLAPGWSGTGSAVGTIELERTDRPAAGRQGSSMDAVGLRVLAGALRAACEEMGAVLVRSAHSANIKERRDCSCALFDAGANMVMQAEHIPVHLGAMPAAVAAVRDREHSEGVSWVLNDPYAGGTHLPDITVVTPVFADEVLLGFAANRAHHADVGGPTPGSMPADSRTLADEGVVIAPQVLDAPAIDRLVAQMRAPAQRRADLRAQLAANRVGVDRLRELSARHAVSGLREATDAVQDYAERRMRACIAALPDGVREARDVLEAAEGDLELRLRATVAGDAITLDFGGSAAQHEGNLNCPLAVTVSACLFALRVLTDPDIPASAGASRALTVLAPEGSLLNARPPAAVVAGNVETSSRVADLVLAAFGRALGQGTMNNVTLGTEAFTYYETLGGGQGACADSDGPSGVHVAMSNTLNTPIEALENEFPLRVTEYALRRGTGGAGAFRGGNGVVREYEALEDMTYSLLTERRRHAPPGADGGGPGARGRNSLDDAELAPKARGTLRAGQRLRIETPGGGGHGEG